MAHFPTTARGHLRLAGSPAEETRPENRAMLLARAVAAVVVLAFLTVLAWASAAVALAPIMWRRAPLGCRLRPLRPREARIIPFQPRTARQSALPR